MGCGSSSEVQSNASPNKLQGARPNKSNGVVHNNGLMQQVPPSHNPPSARRASTPPSVWPKVVRRPGMSFEVHVYCQEMLNRPNEPLPSWVYISRGLSQINQPEIVFTLAIRRDENEQHFPDAPVEWMRIIYALATNGLHFEKGQMGELLFENSSVSVRVNRSILKQDPKIWADMRSFGSLVHTVPHTCNVFSLPDGALPRNYHTVIALTREETVVAKQFGVTRVISNLGLSYRCFPYPAWNARDRKDCVTMADQAGSFRIGKPLARIYGVNCILYEDDIILTVPAKNETRDKVREWVVRSPEAAPCFETFMADDAESGLVWKTGQKQAMGYTKNTCAIFLILAAVDLCAN
jgi:hypothetical protein